MSITKYVTKKNYGKIYKQHSHQTAWKKEAHIVDKIGKIGQRILRWQWMGMGTDSKSGQFQHIQ